MSWNQSVQYVTAYQEDTTHIALICLPRHAPMATYPESHDLVESWCFEQLFNFLKSNWLPSSMNIPVDEGGMAALYHVCCSSVVRHCITARVDLTRQSIFKYYRLRNGLFHLLDRLTFASFGRDAQILLQLDKN